MGANLSHPPLAVHAKDTVPYSDDLLLSRKNSGDKILVTKYLERFQGLFVVCLMPYKTEIMSILSSCGSMCTSFHSHF